MSSRPNKNTKQRVWVRDNFKCVYCGINLLPEFETNYPSVSCRITVDHKLARHLGGTNTIDNLVTACRDCNLKKDKLERPATMNT